MHIAWCCDETRVLTRTRVDIVVIDVAALTDSCADILRALQARNPALKVILTSRRGYQDLALTKKLSVGNVRFLPKPYSAAQLRAVLEK